MDSQFMRFSIWPSYQEEVGFAPGLGNAIFIHLNDCFICFVLETLLKYCYFRYKRRGVDEDGKCANYVETEQLVWYHDHQVSFVQVRGSVPVYWSQPGYKYKPPPRIDRGINPYSRKFNIKYEILNISHLLQTKQKRKWHLKSILRKNSIAMDRYAL